MGFFDFVRRVVDPFEIGGEQDDEDTEGFEGLAAIIDPAGEFLAGRQPETNIILDPLGLFDDPEDPTDIPDVADEDAGLTPAALGARRKALARKGRQSTFRTGGQGVLQTATPQKPTLFREG